MSLISAKEAYEITRRAQQKLAEKEFPELEGLVQEAIAKATQEGRTGTNLNIDKFSAETRARLYTVLRDLGYSVSTVTFDYGPVHISWSS